MPLADKGHDLLGATPAVERMSVNGREDTSETNPAQRIGPGRSFVSEEQNEWKCMKKTESLP